MANETAAQNTGKVVQIIGPVIDVEFPAGLPAIYNALQVKSDAGGVAIDVIAEVAQHLGENRVRAVAMKPTDGMQRGMEAVDLGQRRRGHVRGAVDVGQQAELLVVRPALQ